MTVRTISRREALTRLSTMASALGLVGCVYPETDSRPAADNGWPELRLAEVTAKGYGTDPDLIHPSTPWPNLLASSEMNTLSQVCEILIPGARQAGVPEVISEWLSAPYPDQQQDRQLIQPGLIWVSVQASANHEMRELILQLVDRGDQGDMTAVQVRFVQRLRYLAAGAYFSSPQGVAELGYVGNQPIAGDYPGPSADATAHLNHLLEELGLSLPG